MKYGYGKINWGKEHSKEPEVYALQNSEAYHRLLSKRSDATIRDIYPFYTISDDDNRKHIELYKIHATLSVWQNHNTVYASIVFHNESDSDYFVYKAFLPSGRSDYSELCGNSFLITSGNVKLDYLGKHCYFDNKNSENIKDSWEVIKSGSKHSFNVALNRAYEFLPGRNEYNIGTLEYSFITKEWFIENNIYQTAFNIFDWVPPCPTLTNHPLVIERRWLCPQYTANDHSFKSILRKLGFHYQMDWSKYYFEIRTNQLNVDIDGNPSNSFYRSRIIR